MSVCVLPNRVWDVLRLMELDAASSAPPEPELEKTKLTTREDPIAPFVAMAVGVESKAGLHDRAVIDA